VPHPNAREINRSATSATSIVRNSTVHTTVRARRTGSAKITRKPVQIVPASVCSRAAWNRAVTDSTRSAETMNEAAFAAYA